MKKINPSLLIILIVMIFSSIVIQANPIQVKDYISDKFPTTLNLYLSSLEELDETEKEFIDLLLKVSPNK